MERIPKDQFTEEQAHEMLLSSSDFSGWKYDEGKKMIEKTFSRKNFLDCVAFIGKIAELAEKQDHHPDLLLFDYKNLRVMLTTHSAGGVTQNDFDLARAIEHLP